MSWMYDDGLVPLVRGQGRYVKCPYPPGRWFVGDVTPEGDGMVHQDDRLTEWIESKGCRPDETYGVTVVGVGRPWFAFIHRFDVNENGRKFRNAGHNEPARRFPKLVSV